MQMPGYDYFLALGCDSVAWACSIGYEKCGRRLSGAPAMGRRAQIPIFLHNSAQGKMAGFIT